MTVQEAIKDIKENIKPVVGGKSLDLAIEALEKQISLERIVKKLEKLSLDGIRMFEDEKYELIRKKEAIYIVKEEGGFCD